MDTDFLGWSSTMAPLIVGDWDRPELGDELSGSFCRTSSEAARRFARLVVTATGCRGSCSRGRSRRRRWRRCCSPEGRAVMR